MSGDKVTLFGFWASPFSLRVIWALKLKGIEYEYVEEDLHNKSSLLMQYNPVHKQIPVLVHNGNPVAESLVVIEYIDETWQGNPILPKDPYERSRARFWANYADTKVVPALMATFSKVGQEQQNAAEDARESLKTLEKGLEGKHFFGGETIGFADIAAAWIGIWSRMVEEVVGLTLIDEETMPLLCSWLQHVLEAAIIKDCIPPRDKLLEHIRSFLKQILGFA